MARVIVESILLIEATLSQWVTITEVDGNIANAVLSPSGEAFAQNWSDLIVSFAWAMDQMLRTVWGVY